MKRSELIQAFYQISQTEAFRKKHPESGPSRYYRFLEEQGYKEANGIFHMPSISFTYPGETPSDSVWDLMDASPYQSLFRMKKASRFSREPFSYADFLSIRYVYSGEDHMETLTGSFTLHRNDFCLMNAGFVQSQHLMHEEDVVFTLMFEKDYLIRSVLNTDAGNNLISRFIYSYVLNSENPKNYMIFHGKDNDIFPRLIEDMILEYTHPTELGRILLESWLQVLLVQMTYSDCEFEETRESRQSLHFAEILNEIDHEYQTVSLKGLSEAYGYNADYISRQIRKLTGKNFKDYLLERRMDQVCILLRNTSLPMSEILVRTGFTNETHFYRTFKKMYGMTPKEYRTSQ